MGDAFAFDLIPDADPDKRIIRFTNYMLETFVCDDAMFSPSLLAILPCDDGDDTPRTTNGAEAFHRLSVLLTFVSETQ